MTGRELLELADKKPAEGYAIYLKVKGGQPQRIDLDQKIDLSQPGVERFVTLPLDQTEGFGGRRDFALPQEDLEWLNNNSGRFELVAEGGVLPWFFTVSECRPATTTARLTSTSASNPATQTPRSTWSTSTRALERADGRPVPATCVEPFDGKEWQRWSRHRTPANPWRPGIDNLATHFGLVEHWFLRELKRG